MVDVAHDRVELWKAQVRMLLGSKITVKSPRFSGNRFSCHKYYFGLPKHFAGYGFAESGRDYNTVDVSETTTEYYISSF
jgi:beta-glucosidase